MKKIINPKFEPYVTLPGGISITPGCSMVVLNDDILKSEEVKKLIDQEHIIIEDFPEQNDQKDT